MIGIGEFTTLVGREVRSLSPILLFSLGAALLPLRALLSLSPFSTRLSVESSGGFWFFGLGVRQAGKSHAMPVKLLSWSGFRSHLRHGAPERSRTRELELIAPWLALGPTLGPGGRSFPGSAGVSSLYDGKKTPYWVSKTVDGQDRGRGEG